LSSPLSDLRDHERGTYSQFGEEGVLARIFESIGVRHRFCVEFGAKDGETLSNTASLRRNHGWSSLLMEGDPAWVGEGVQTEFVTAENVNELFAKHAVPTEFDLLSIDVDGNDYWIWRAIDAFEARVVVVEYNIFFAPGDAKTMPYDAHHVWDETSYHGASLGALHKLGREKGYALVHTDSWAPNAFFVLRSELPDDFVERPIDALTDWNRFTKPPDPHGREWGQV